MGIGRVAVLRLRLSCATAAGAHSLVTHLPTWAPLMMAVPATPPTRHHCAQVTGHWPDYSNQDDLAKLGAEAFAFVNVARFAVPLRIGLALSTTPWVRDNVVENIPFLAKKVRGRGRGRPSPSP